MEASVRTAIAAWLADPAIEAEDKKEIRDLLAAGDEKELTERFYCGLEFGTGGMRGTMGAGLNRMNLYTVGAAAQGLANHLARQGPAACRAGVVIAYDCRHNSRRFAERTACVLAANGITAHLFEDLRPTPELSFAVRHLGCAAGVVITASHNPPAYNGLKVYGADGVQVVPPQDQEIIDEVRRVVSFANVRLIPFHQARAEGLVRVVGRQEDEAFLNAVEGFRLAPEVCRTQGHSLKIVYTPLHGTGTVLVPEALRRRGFEQVIEVPEQARPDGNFPTVASPNPEEPAALSLAIELARRQGADLVIATDPDADRMGVAVRTAGSEFQHLTGNQTAALMTWFICDQLRASGRFPDNGAVISTIVSGDMAKDIARAYGAEVIEVLTGFKWIGQKVAEFEGDGELMGTGRRPGPGRPSKTYLFGSEESYGYMPATYTRDKDAVTSAAVMADLAAVAAARGRNVHDVLLELFRRFGYYQEETRSLRLPGKEGAARIKGMMEALRAEPPRTIGGYAVAAVADLLSGEKRELEGGQVVGRYDLPASDVLLFTLADGTKVVARPSGTEPKIKFYVLSREPGDDLGRARAAASERIKRIMEELIRLAE